MKKSPHPFHFAHSRYHSCPPPSWVHCHIYLSLDGGGMLLNSPLHLFLFHSSLSIESVSFECVETRTLIWSNSTYTHSLTLTHTHTHIRRYSNLLLGAQRRRGRGERLAFTRVKRCLDANFASLSSFVLVCVLWLGPFRRFISFVAFRNNCLAYPQQLTHFFVGVTFALATRLAGDPIWS